MRLIQMLEVFEDSWKSFRTAKNLRIDIFQNISLIHEAQTEQEGVSSDSASLDPGTQTWSKMINAVWSCFAGVWTGLWLAQRTTAAACRSFSSVLQAPEGRWFKRWSFWGLESDLFPPVFLLCYCSRFSLSSRPALFFHTTVCSMLVVEL